MNKRIYWIVLLIIIIIGIGVYIYSPNTSQVENTQSTSSTNSQPYDNNSGATPTNQAQDTGNTGNSQTPVKVKEFIVSGSNFSMSPNVITVNKGDTVKITFRDDNGFHNLQVEGYGVGTPNLQTGGESVIQFVADKAGTFQYYCSVDSHRDKGMVGKLIVNP